MQTTSSDPHVEPDFGAGSSCARGPPDPLAPGDRGWPGSQPERGALTEQSDDLQWLVALAADAQRPPAGHSGVHQLLARASTRLRSALGALYAPEKHLCLVHRGDCPDAGPLAAFWVRARDRLSVWALQKREPLVLNSAGKSGAAAPRCKILVVPLCAESGRLIGVLAFFRTAGSRDYRRRDCALGMQLGRLALATIEAQFDALTGLLTREALEQRQACVKSERADLDQSVLYFDVDQTHVVNDLYGFEIGNEMLVKVANVLAPPRLPEGALAARISADRFAVVLPNTDTAGAAALAEHLQASIRGLTIGPLDGPIGVSASCGVAPLLAMPQGLSRALAAAEFACKTAKHGGRDRLKIDSCDDGTMLRGHVDAVTVGQLRTALKSDQLLLYAQPIVPLRNAALPGGYEVLLRLNDPSQGVVLPGMLVQVAHRYQLLPMIDQWVVRKALQLLGAHREMLAARRLGISINLSGQSIGDEEFTRELGEMLRAAHLPAGCVTFEITEQAAVSSLARAEEMIRRLAPLNCRFALDDFGTGSNSLAYLNALPIARVKIDGTFVQDILANSRSQATVRGIVELARGFSIDTVAEFVESDAIAKRVRELGVDYAQGYAFGAPEPLETVLAGLYREASRQSPRLPLEA
jgi:diguanylate cyclase (GGDEF)-like protein